MLRYHGEEPSICQRSLLRTRRGVLRCARATEEAAGNVLEDIASDIRPPSKRAVTCTFRVPPVA